jgi:phosphohistidine phosphatase
MNLYLVRHAIAEEIDGYEDDSLRPLTERGSEKMQKIAQTLKEIGVKPDLIVSSPYVRASQTASILAKELKYKAEIAYCDFLVPMGEPDDMIGEINEKYSVDELMLVGHEPNLSGLTSVLLAGNPDLSINFKKGGVCCLSLDNLHYDRKAVLEWLVTPKISARVT